MRNLLIVSLLTLSLATLSGCLVQTDNSVKGDSQLFAKTPAGTSQAFAAVSTILRTHCASCHSSDIASYSETQFVAHALVVPGQPMQSKLYQKLQGSNAGGGVSEDMPQNAAPLSTADLQTIKNWIEDLNLAPAPAPSTPYGQASVIIVNSCVGCHKDMAAFQEVDFVAHGYVVPGNAEASKLYYKLVGSNTAWDGTPDMPLSGNSLSTTDLQIMRTWINQMSPQAFPSPTVFPDTSFGRVQKVIGDNCLLCHGKFGGFSEADFVTQRLVIPGNSAQSMLFAKLIGSNTGTSTKADMPEKGAPLTAQQLQDVKQWIEQLSPTIAPIPAPSSSSGVSMDQAVAEIAANFELKVRPVVKKGCIECHSVDAKPQGFPGETPGLRQLELKDIANATRVVDFSKPFPLWSQQSNSPLFFATEVRNVIQQGTMPLLDFKLFHKFDGEDLTPAEDQILLDWATSSIAILNSVNTSPPTVAQFITNRCIGCHSANNASGGLAFQTNGDQVAYPTGNSKSGIPFVSQLSPENSAIYLALLTDSSSRKGLTQMPFGDTATTAEQQLIYKWIKP